MTTGGWGVLIAQRAQLAAVAGRLIYLALRTATAATVTVPRRPR